MSDYNGSTPIVGDGVAPAGAIRDWLAAGGQEPELLRKYAPGGVYRALPPDVGDMVLEAAAAWQPHVVNADLLAGMFSKEAAYGQSAICRDKANPSGLGAENDDSTGSAYEKAIDFTEGGTVPYPVALRRGIRATAAHLLSYAIGAGPWTAEDPRWFAVKAAGWDGDAPQVGQLSRKWASPGIGYGEDVAERGDALRRYAIAKGAVYMATQYEQQIPGLVDIRALLDTRQPGEGGVPRGPYERIRLTDKRGIVIHFRGVVSAEKPGYGTYQADATYHVGKNWSRAGDTPVFGSGIMYHVGVGFDGTGYLMRDLDRVLWHCGAWPQNENTLAIQLPLGLGQQPTAAQLATLHRICEAWLAYTGAPRSEVWGHRELSPTDCPGELLGKFVYPFRQGVQPPVVQPPAPEIPTDAVRDPWGSPYRNDLWILQVFMDWIDKRGGFWSMGHVRGPAFIEERMENGQLVRILCQYFEGGRLEWHPRNPPEYRVLRGLTGNEVIDFRYGGQLPV